MSTEKPLPPSAHDTQATAVQTPTDAHANRSHWFTGIGDIENTHLQQFLFLIILLMMIAAGVQGLNLIETPEDAATLRAIAYIGLSVMGCIFAYVLTLQARTRAATAVAITSLAIPIFMLAWGSGLGIRAPVIYLWTPPILLAYYVLGPRGGQLVTLSACVAAIFLYVMEARGELTGFNASNMPLSTNNLIVVWLVITCGLAAANAIRERKEAALQFAQDRRALLAKALADIELAEASQRQFMDKVSGTVAAQALELQTLAYARAAEGSGKTASSVSLDTQSITQVSQRMMLALDSAVEQTERETRFFLEDNTAQTG